MSSRTSTSPSIRRPGTFDALRYRNFRLMWVSLIVSNSGTWLQSVAQDYLVYQMTGRALDLGIVNAVRAVALITLPFFGGTIADRLDRRKLLIATQALYAVSAAVLGLLVQFHLVRVWHIAALAFFNAVLLAVDNPVRQSLVPQLVPREALMNAIALNSVSYTGAAALGPMLAGPIVNTFGMAWGFYLNAISYFAVVWAVWAMRLPRATTPRQSEPVGTAVVSGLRYVAASPTILLVVAILTIYSFFATPFQTLLPVFSVSIFGGGVVELSNLRTAMGIGALAGGFLLARFSGFPYKGWLVLGGGLGFSAALLAFSQVHWLSAGLVLVFLASLASAVFQSSLQNIMQHETSDQMRGRVMSLFAISLIGVWPLGAWPLSWAADAWGAPTAITTGALIAAAFAIAAALAPGKRLLRL